MFGLKWRIKDFFYMFIAGLFVIIFVAILNHATSSKMITIKESDKKTQEVLNPLNSDFIIGDSAAPIELIFYGDFTCHHCKRFMKDVFFKLNDEYISKKKVKFIFRPVISLKRSLYGAKFLFCDKRTDKENIDILWKMFDKNWTMSENYVNALGKLVKKENWSTIEHFVACLNSKKVQNALQNIYKKTVEPLNIHETPHVFINKKIVKADASVFNVIDQEYKEYRKKTKS